MIRIEDVAFVGFRAPDLDRMQTYLEAFGLWPVERTDERLFMRGYGAAPFVHVTERGPAGFAILGLRAASRDDLETLARDEAVKIRPSDSPGGGVFAELHDPDGHCVRIVAGQTDAPIAAPESQAWNTASAKPRAGDKRLAKGPAHVMRLGHVVLNVSDFRASERWYKERFGFITSDEIALSPDLSIAAFMRCDRGATPSDHHSLFLLQAPTGPGFNHAAFEVLDLDDLMTGRDALLGSEGRPVWGVGRHVLGGQVFDYWRDPWGHTLEHWTDGDLMTAADGSRQASVRDLMAVQWGPSMSPDMA